jgi:hypothetical protein
VININGSKGDQTVMIVDIMTNGSSHKRKGAAGETAQSTSIKPHHNRLNKLSNGSQISSKMLVNVPLAAGSRNQTSAKRVA